MTLFLIIAAVAVGVVGLGYAFHKWTSQTTAVIDTTATAVNTVINDVKAATAKKPTANT